MSYLCVVHTHLTVITACVFACADLCLSLHSVRVQTILVEELTVIMQVSPEVKCIHPQLGQENSVEHVKNPVS